MTAKCISIEADADFAAEIRAHDTIAFCYPIYNSRVPRIMREFAHCHMADLRGKKVIILVSQQFVSGDGAKVFADLFDDDAIEVIYAEHFNMQQNMGNIPVWEALFKPTERSGQRFIKKTEERMNIVCNNIKNGIVKKRGFCIGSTLLGYIQGKPWQKDTKEIKPVRLEKRLMHDVRIHEDCTNCGICVKICPMKNLVSRDGRVAHLSNCTICYRCVNRCPQRAITVYIHRKPKWQYFLG